MRNIGTRHGENLRKAIDAVQWGANLVRHTLYEGCLCPRCRLSTVALYLELFVLSHHHIAFTLQLAVLQLQPARPSAVECQEGKHGHYTQNHDYTARGEA